MNTRAADDLLSAGFPPPPRRVQRRSGSPDPILQRLLTVPVAAVVLVIILLWARDAVVRFAGTPVTTHITRKWENRGRNLTYHVAYEYTLDGRTFDDDDTVDDEIYSRLTSPVPARTANFLGAQTAQLMLGPIVYWEVRILLFIATVVWSAVLIYQWRLAWLLPGLDRRLIERGQVAGGTVMHKWVNDRRNTPVFWARVAFHCGPLHERFERDMRCDPSVFGSFEPGSPVTVFYDPGKPKRAVAYELSEFVIMDAAG